MTNNCKKVSKTNMAEVAGKGRLWEVIKMIRYTYLRINNIIFSSFGHLFPILIGGKYK